MSLLLDKQAEAVTVRVAVDGAEWLPVYGSGEAAGADVKACLEVPCVLDPGERALIPTGLRVQLPKGYEIQVRPRSGLAAKHGIGVLNTPGTIDSDYRGEIKVILINHSQEPFTITPGMRIAQLIVAPVLRVEWLIAEELDETERGASGFGGSGY